jgi:hypothetical protein
MRRRSFSVLLATLALSTGACHSWNPQTSPAPDVIAAQPGRTMRVIRRDHSTLVLANPQVVGDSLVGTAGNPPQRVAVATADVQRIDTRSMNAWKTGGLVMGTLLVVSAVAVAAAVAALLGGWS